LLGFSFLFAFTMPLIFENSQQKIIFVMTNTLVSEVLGGRIAYIFVFV